MRYRNTAICVEELVAIDRAISGGPLDATDLLPAGSAYALCQSRTRRATNIVASTVAHRELGIYTSYADLEEVNHG